MKKTIWKYDLKVDDIQTLQMQKEAEVLSVQMQGNQLCLWALVDPGVEQEERIFEVFGTGHPIPCDMGVNRNFIPTFQLRGGALVFHVFERIN